MYFRLYVVHHFQQAQNDLVLINVHVSCQLAQFNLSVLLSLLSKIILGTGILSREKDTAKIRYCNCALSNVHVYVIFPYLNFVMYKFVSKKKSLSLYITEIRRPTLHSYYQYNTDYRHYRQSHYEPSSAAPGTESLCVCGTGLFPFEPLPWPLSVVGSSLKWVWSMGVVK